MSAPSSGSQLRTRCVFLRRGGDARSSTAFLPVVGSAVGGAIGSSAFFVSATPTPTIVNSTVRDNQAFDGSNTVVGALFAPNDAGSGRGGAVGAVAGDVSISDSTVRDNLAQGGKLRTFIENGSVVGASGPPAFGGGIHHQFNFGFSAPPTPMTLSITDSTVSGNAARAPGPSAAASGGGALCCTAFSTSLPFGPKSHP